MNKRVVVAMSGGVDSSVAAALLKEQGFEVIGVTMQIWPKDNYADEIDRFGGCCSLSAIEDARKVAATLNIPHYVLNFRDIFLTKVIKNFINEYQCGRTPNPCIRCNQYIKFEALLEKSKVLGASHVATGHYARIIYNNEKKRFLLKRGVDEAKDQSYVLYIMTQDQLAHTLMPLGYYTKLQTRQKAKELGLGICEKPDSQEICFIPDNDYGAFLARECPEVVIPGPILDVTGKEIGQHKGIIFYTVGQRKGLGLAYREPLYVIEIDKKRNALIVGDEEKLYRNGLIANEINLIPFDEIASPANLLVKIRYNAPAVAAVVMAGDGQAEITFTEPQKAISPGQAVVFYQGDLVVGGATIVSS